MFHPESPASFRTRNPNLRSSVTNRLPHRLISRPARCFTPLSSRQDIANPTRTSRQQLQSAETHKAGLRPAVMLPPGLSPGRHHHPHPAYTAFIPFPSSHRQDPQWPQLKRSCPPYPSPPPLEGPIPKLQLDVGDPEFDSRRSKHSGFCSRWLTLPIKPLSWGHWKWGTSAVSLLFVFFFSFFLLVDGDLAQDVAEGASTSTSKGDRHLLTYPIFSDGSPVPSAVTSSSPCKSK